MNPEIAYRVLYDFLNNASVSGILILLIASIFASTAYAKQKRLDRVFEIKKDIADKLSKVKEYTRVALLILDRIGHTYQRISKDEKKTGSQSFLEGLEKTEIPRLSKVINEDIPLAWESVKVNIEDLFENNNDVNIQYEQAKNALKKWHDNILFFRFDITKTVAEQEVLSLKEFDQELKKLSKTIWKKEIEL